MRTFTTMPHIADAMRGHLLAGRDPEALSILVDGVNTFPSLTSPGEIRVFLARPQPFDDPRWDAMLAATVAYRARLAGVEPPRWTHVAPLDASWWPAGETDLRERTKACTPMEFEQLGIWFDRAHFATA